MNRRKWWIISWLILPGMVTAQQPTTVPDGGLPRGSGDQLLYTTLRSRSGDVFVFSDGEIIPIPTDILDYKTCSAWMPDGNRIVYAATGLPQDGMERLYLMNADGSDNHPLMPAEIGPHRTFRLDPSPDGRRILWGVEVVDSVVWHVFDIATGSLQILEDIYQASWSPDGSKLAVLRDNAIHLLDVATGEMTLFADGMVEAVWSPDGSHLAARSFDFNTRFSGITVMNADGTHPVEVLSPFTAVSEVDWSPDGTQLAVRISDPEVEVFTGGHFIILLDIETGDYRYLTDSSVNPVTPSWSPDGSKLAFFALFPDSTLGFNMAILDITDETLTRVPANVLRCVAPIWRPGIPD